MLRCLVTGDCPIDWIYHGESGKCYEFVVNPNRVQTWTNAKQICTGIGAGLLKIERYKQRQAQNDKGHQENYMENCLSEYCTPFTSKPTIFCL